VRLAVELSGFLTTIYLASLVLGENICR